ncbi:MAG: putative CRISPR-associated protein [Chthonomonadales bacterium]|nr:putative CRISPR-associated protein [Chthonomonadales bacterium]
MRAILSTVGTSLPGNAKRAGQATTPASLAAFLAHTDPVLASAEAHALFRLGAGGDDRLVFIHSADDACRAAAEALRSHHANRGVGARCVEVPGLTASEKGFARRGLRDLVSVLAGEVRRQRHDGREVLLNATGGFKAEIAYATLLGLLLEVPVYYIYETFQQIVELPPLPVAWDLGLMALHEGFFQWIEEEPRPSGQVRERLRELPPALGMLVDEPEEGRQYLSAAGVAFWEAYRERSERAGRARVLLSEAARRDHEALDPTTRAAFDRRLASLRARELWIGQCETVGAGGVRVYPRGDTNERIFLVEGDGGEVRVLGLTRHSDGSYEQRRSAVRAPAPGERFSEWEGP